MVLSQGTRVMLLTRGFCRVESWRVGGSVEVGSCGMVRVGCDVDCCGSDDVVEAFWCIEAGDCVSTDSWFVTEGAAVDCLTAADFLNQVVIEVCISVVELGEDAFSRALGV